MHPLSPFITDAVEKELRKLRDQCSYLKNSVRSYEHTLHHTRTNDRPNKHRDYHIAEAEKNLAGGQERLNQALQTLAAFIAEHRPIMGPEWIGNDHGRLCWHNISSNFCQLQEGHDGPHRNEKHFWETPPPPKPKVIAPELNDTGEHGLGEDFGERDGPCIVRYRHWTSNYHPTYREYSCLGCKHLRMEKPYFTQLCHHPHFLEKYDSPQSIGATHWAEFSKALVRGSFCPALELSGITEHLDQPAPDWQPHLESARPYRREELETIFRIPQPKSPA